MRKIRDQFFELGRRGVAIGQRPAKHLLRCRIEAIRTVGVDRYVGIVKPPDDEGRATRRRSRYWAHEARQGIPAARECEPGGRARNDLDDIVWLLQLERGVPIAAARYFQVQPHNIRNPAGHDVHPCRAGLQNFAARPGSPTAGRASPRGAL